MEATYTTTLDDLFALNMFILGRSPSIRRRLAFGWATLAFGFGLVVLMAYLGNAPLHVLVALGVSGALLVALFPFLLRWSMRRSIRAQLRERGDGVGLTTLTLSDDSVRVKSPVAETVARWNAIKEVVEDDSRTFLLLAGGSAAIIPRRGFERAEEYDAVRDFALAKLRPTV
jgi:hypothetical protein